MPGRITALAPAPDGTVLLLDDRGRLHAVRGTAPRPRTWSGSPRRSRRPWPVTRARPSRRSRARWWWGTGWAPSTPSA
ncbi:hypothetical protein O1L60_30290 [Streptomyces diastatochromogenes]|nr:hypothetical protein [Streptomyces diastatochromogenes]